MPAKKKLKIDEVSSIPLEDIADEDIKPATKRRAGRPRKTVTATMKKSNDNEDTGPQEIVEDNVKPTTKRRGRPQKTATAGKPRAKKTSSREEMSDNDGSIPPEDSSQDSADDDDFKPTTKQRSRPKRTVPARKKRKVEDPSIEDSPQDTADDNVKPVTKQRGRPKKTVGRKRSRNDDSEDDNGIEPVHVKQVALSSLDNSDKPTKSKGKKKPSPASAQDTNNDGSKSQDTNNGGSKSRDTNNGISKSQDTNNDGSKSQDTNNDGSKSQDTNNGNKTTKVNSNNCDVQTLDFTSTATTKDKTPWTMKFASWNVNGVRAWLKNNGFKYVQKELPDIFCLQETKCDEKEIPHNELKLEGYKSYWSSAEQKGYSGTGLFTKTEPVKVSYGIGTEEHDKEGRVITAEFEKFFFVTTYVPNAGDKLKRLRYRVDDWDPAFKKYLKSLDDIKPVIVCGDLNVAHHEIDLANPKTNLKTAGFTLEERESFTTLLKENKFIDSFRQLYPEKKAAYSYWGYRSGARKTNKGWRLDYFLISERLADDVCDHIIRSDVLGSDHCPIVLLMAL